MSTKSELLNLVSKIEKYASECNYRIDMSTIKNMGSNLDILYVESTGETIKKTLSLKTIIGYCESLCDQLFWARNQSWLKIDDLKLCLILLSKAKNIGILKTKFIKALIGTCTKKDSLTFDIMYKIIDKGLITNSKNLKGHSGNTIWTNSQLKETISRYNSSIDAQSIIDYYEELCILTSETFYNSKCYGKIELIDIEKSIEKFVSEKKQIRLPNVINEKFNDCQKNAMEQIIADESKISILLGQAGTGKSFVITSLLLECLYDKIKVCVAAPTNAAVQVISKAIEKDNLSVNELVYGRVITVDGAKWTEAEEEVDVLIIDEAAMLSTSHFSILTKLNPKKIILVGDPGQLPPVEPGCPFSDILRSKKIKPALLLTQMRSKNEDVKNVVENIRNNNKLNLTNIFPFARTNRTFENIDKKIFDKFKEYILANKDNMFLAETNILIDWLNVVLLDARYNMSAFDEDLEQLIKTYFGKNKISPIIDFKQYPGVFAYWDGDAFPADIKDNYRVTRGSLIEILSEGNCKVTCTKTKNFDGPGTKEYILSLDKFTRYINTDNKIRLNFARTVYKAQGSSYQKVTILTKDSDYGLNYQAKLNLVKESIYVGASRAINYLDIICLIDKSDTFLHPQSLRQTYLKVCL